MMLSDCMSRYLTVQPLNSKYVTTISEAFKLMITRKQPKKVWVDKGTEFKGFFEALCEKKGIKTKKHIEREKVCIHWEKYPFLKIFNCKYLEDKWTYSYIDILQYFVNAIDSRTERVTNLSPNKVTKKMFLAWFD